MSLVSQISSALTAVGTEIKAVYTKIGTLASLTTTDKSNLVNAINEVKAGATGAAIDDVTPSSSTVYSSTKTDTAYQPKDSDLTTIAGLTPTTDNFMVAASSAWASRTPTQAKAALAIAESDVASLVSDLAAKAPLASPALTGTPTAPTAAANTNTTQVATTAYVQTELTDLIAAAPGALDTLDELAAALGDDAAFSSTVTTALGNRVRVDAVQGLTGGQKTQARSNIDVYSTTEIGDPTTDLAAVFAAALV